MPNNPFLKDLEEVYTPKLRKKNQENENRFALHDATALQNMKEIFTLVCSREFATFLQEWEPLTMNPIICLPAELNDLALEESDINSFYRKALGFWRDGTDVTLVLGEGYIQINTEALFNQKEAIKFYDSASLFLSPFRYLFLSVTRDGVEKHIMDALKKEGVLK